MAQKTKQMKGSCVSDKMCSKCVPSGPNIDVNNMQFKIFFMQMFHEEGNTLNDFIKPEGYTQCVLVETQKKASTLFIRKLHRAPLPNLYALCIDIDKFFWFNQHI